MRLSSVLSKRIRHDFLPVYVKKHWRESGSRMTAQRLRVPRQLLAVADSKNLEELASAEDMLTSRRYHNSEASPATKLPADHDIDLFDKFGSDNLDPRTGNTEHSLLFDSNRLFTKGLAQACMLANAVIRPGVPPMMKAMQEKVNRLLNEDHSRSDFDLVSAVEQSVLHAHLWQTDEDPLPKRYNPDMLIWKFKAEYGIHPVRLARYLLLNLFRLCELHTQRMGLAPLPHCATRNRLLETFIFWGNGKRRIQFTEFQDLMLSSSQPTTLFYAPTHLSKEDQMAIEECKQKMHLISPLIDLTSTTYYRRDSVDAWVGVTAPKFPFPNLITVNMALPNTWSDFTAPEKDRISIEQRQAAAIMNCLASTIATARRIYGDVAHIPEPIAIEAVCTDGVHFDFVGFQLNTLRFPNWIEGPPEQVNYIWIDGGHRLVDKRIPRRSLLRNTRYVDLNMSVFHRLMASYLWALPVLCKEWEK